MPSPLDTRLQALSALDYGTPPDGLENAVWARVEQRKQEARAASPRVQLSVAAAALALGVVIGLGHGATKPSAVSGSEIRVLSDDTGLAPSIRLGGV